MARLMMCGCEPGYVCSLCRNTPRDDHYEDDEPRKPERVTVVFVNENGSTVHTYLELSS